MQFPSQPTHLAPPSHGRPQKLVYVLTFACVVLLTTVLALLTNRVEPVGGRPGQHALNHLTDIANLSPPDQTGNIFVSYSYFEKDEVQVRSSYLTLLVLHARRTTLGLIVPAQQRQESEYNSIVYCGSVSLLPNVS